MKGKGGFALFGIIAAFLAGQKATVRHASHDVSGANRQRFNLGGLPQAWKGKRMARIMRGGK